MYKGSNKNLICDWCQVEETTEHYIQCKKRRQITGIQVNMEVVKEGVNMNKHRQAALYVTWTEEDQKEC